jgi:N-acetyltransferase 10
MIKNMKNAEDLDNNWIQVFLEDFKRRFISLLSFEFRILPTGLCLGIIDPRLSGSEEESKQVIPREELQHMITLYDLKRLESYRKNQVDYHLILDLLPNLARTFFLKRF